MREADLALARRDQRYESLKTAAQLTKYQQRLRDFFIAQLGGLPEATPLNAKVVGKLPGDGFRVEKILFESRPRHYVTAVLYLPESGKPPYPAVLVPCGHSPNGKAADSYQRVGMLLARSGMAAMCYDPIGQGERYQFLDADGRPRFKSTTEHTLVGVSCILVGRNTASYRVWDGMRALDYLAAREDIDAARLGCTGNSGGGTLTEYLMALDDRILCAAPGCSVTTFRRRLATIGPGDAEQNIYAQIAFGMDHPDYFHMRAPRPTLICSATRDFVDINGSWHIFRESKRLYTTLGYPERIDLIEADEKHGFTRPLREGVARWMRRWLLETDDAVTEPDLAVFSEKQLRCTPTGQVQQIQGARSVMDFNVAAARQYAPQRQQLWQDQHQALAKVQRLAGIRGPHDIAPAKARKVGQLQRDGFRIDKYVLQTDSEILLPALLFVPSEAKGRRILYLHEQGKGADAGKGQPIEKLAAMGNVVLAVDLRGTGETGSPQRNLWGGDWNDIFLSYLLGKSMLAMRTEDVLLAARFLSEHDVKLDRRVHVISKGTVGPPALHAVALQPERFATLHLDDGLPAWQDVIADPTISGQLVNTVHAALTTYELPDLVKSLPANTVTIGR